MKPLLQTARLDLYNCKSLITSRNSAAIITGILTPDTAAFLPEDWQTRPDANHAFDWLNNKLIESEIYLALPKGTINQASLKLQNVPLGLFIFHIEQSIAHIGYLINEQYWHQGYGTELLFGCLAYLRTQSLAKTVYAGVDPNNLGSVRTLEKCNFQIVSNDAQKNTFYTLHL
ncbi:GNAT family N-acetyltransferase [Pseudoalteromonas luteoviolacea]|uniref:N-acetyltransferase domain-containing protein n=1 Tax=Pseudoalteromonas luteoviolacea NCIMB 1942 TaxID=1365253 RepID=A0A167CP05_9GAMM|nr:GNAT family N-acetyltransferase [Pseudoalteromonas luteoviolacea]KZN47890.1 hypothetical protein N482_01190 [Pseudoalteromonas luteoviolacea NCIMB 1942]KZX02381.1 hypothetical protein JL49_00080 [Pseudoalteromonas luteoviolacea]